MRTEPKNRQINSKKRQRRRQEKTLSAHSRLGCKDTRESRWKMGNKVEDKKTQSINQSINDHHREEVEAAS